MSARNRRTISVRLNDDDERTIAALRAQLDEASDSGRRLYGQLTPELELLRDVRGKHAAYGQLSDSQTVRWALRFALDRWHAPQLTDRPPAPPAARAGDGAPSYSELLDVDEP